MAKDLIAGCFGGIGIVAVGHPFDTIKVRLQTQSATNPLYTGMTDCIKKTVKWEGLGGFYKGFMSPLWGNMIFNAVQFIVYGQAKEAIGHGEILSLPNTFLAGAITGVAVTFVETPMDLFKSQLQVQIIRAKDNPEYKAQFTSVSGAIKQIIKTNGIFGCWQGFCTTLIRDTIGVSLYFGFYEIYRRALLKKDQPLTDMEKQGTFTKFMAGGVAGVAYWGCIYPLDIVKSSLQVEPIVKSERQYKGFMSCAKAIYKKGGVKAFFPGFAPCIIRAFIGNAACFVCYEQSKAIMNKLF